MAEKIIELSIDKLAGLGDGVGLYEGKKTFIPYTAENDRVSASIYRETADGIYAELKEVIAPGKDRVQPRCSYFSKCGGCALQHISDSAYISFKQAMAQEAIRKAGFDITAENMIRLPAASRRRVELKVDNGKMGFYAERSRNIVDIDDCKIMEPELLKLALQIKKEAGHLKGTIQINGADNGYDLLLEGINALHLENEKVLRISVREGSVVKTLHQHHPVTVTLGHVKVEVQPGAFLQASSQAQYIMTDLVLASAGDASNALDLFSGIGTYSFPLSAKRKVTAIEGEKTMVQAMQGTIQKNDISNMNALHRDLFHNPMTKNDLKKYDFVVINPPRIGAKSQSEQLALTDIRKILMISCNPATFTRDARMLKEGGFTLKKLTPIDQFVYSSHLELVAEFVKN